MPQYIQTNSDRFLDDIIEPFEKPAHLQEFVEYINNQHPIIRFLVEAEINAFPRYWNI